MVKIIVHLWPYQLYSLLSVRHTGLALTISFFLNQFFYMYLFHSFGGFVCKFISTCVSVFTVCVFDWFTSGFCFLFHFIYLFIYLFIFFFFGLNYIQFSRPALHAMYKKRWMTFIHESDIWRTHLIVIWL